MKIDAIKKCLDALELLATFDRPALLTQADIDEAKMELEDIDLSYLED